MKDNKKTITKKLLAFTLAFILLMTSLPLNVFAEMGNESNSNFIEENAGKVKNPVGIGKNSKEENFEEIEATDLDVDSIKGEKAKESPYQAAKNPDNLVGNEIPDGTINYGPFEETKIFKVSGNMIRNAENRESSAPQWVQNLINPGGTLDPDLVNEGSVKAYKPVVEEDPNIANKWTVKMLVAARDSVKTSKIVLVIDTSGSMNDFGRMKGAKNAANAFVDNVLDGSQSTQIGIVRFASNVSIVSDFTSNKAKLHSAINALSATGGTFTQAGVKQARTMLAGSGADKKYMVVLSDGVPTFNYKISHPNNYLIDGGPGSHTHEKQTGKQLPENEFLYNESATGSGNSMWKQYERVKIGGGIFPTYEYHYYNSGNCAIAESGFAKAANMRVFTVGLQTDATGSGVLRDIASAPGDFTEVTDVSQLTPVFEQIAAQILKTVNQATVNVNFNTGFQLPDDFDPTTAGHSPGSEITVVDGKPKWTMATVATVFDENDPSLKYEYITYTVTINDAILKNNSPENGINPLGQISMTYTDQNGNPQTTDFPETQVTPKLFVLNKVVTNNAGGAAVDSDKREFQFKVEKVVGSGYTYHETIGLRPGEQKIIHNPDKNADYRVYELSTAKVYDENNENPLNFNVTTYYNKFEVTANGDLPTTTGDAPAGDGIGKSITGSIPGGTAGKRLNVTFKNWEEEEARAKISIHKIVEQSRGISRQTPPTFTINLKRKAGVVPGMENEHNWDQTVGMNQTVTIPHMMRFTTYIVTEKDLASILPYAPKLGEQGKEVEITLYKVTAGGALGQVIDFTNVYNSSATVNVTATKTWENGPDADHTAPVFELYADGNKVEGVTPTIVPSSGTATSFTYTWTVQAINATTHLPIEYTVKEAGVGADNKITVNNHIYTVSQHGNEITNTYEIPNNGTFTATKVWSGDEKVTRPTMNFELWRRIGNAAGEQVPGAEVKEINGSITTATWTGLETTTAAGDEYTFYVKESLKNPGDVNNDNWILGEFNTQNNSITNTVKTGDENLGKLTVAKKLLETGNGVRGLRGTPIKFSFKVTGPANYEETFELAPGESKVLTGLYFGEYKVEETNTQGYTATYSVADGKVTLKATEKEKTVEVTNTSGGQGTVVEKTLEKVWVNGPKPTVTIELWRKNNVEGADKIDEKVDEFIVPANASGNDLKKTFTNLAKHDSKGNEFEYYAKEENVPVNYTKSENGLVVTNTYTQLSNGEVTVTKVWKDPDGKTLVKPEVNLTLYRKIEGGAEEQVPVAEAEVKVVDGTTTTAKWENLKTTDINGNAYSFIVKESFKNADDVNNDNWTLVASTDVVNGAATITNKAVTGEENLGKLTVAKKLLETGNGVRGLRGTPIKFSFKVTGPANYEETFELAPGESKVLTGLYFGEYKVEETNTQGYTATYSVADGKVTLKATEKEKTVEVTNTSGGQGTVVEKTLEKVWVNGPKPTVTIELWRKNNVEGADKIDEKVDEFIVPANASGNDLKKTFTNLAKHDSKGNEFEYYAKEENVPANYKKSIEGLKVTNTYVSPIVPPTILKGDVTANKIWRDYKAIHPTIWFKLYRNIVGGNLEEVPNAEIKELKEGTTKVTWTKQNLEDKKGNKYIFSVKEVDSNGRDYVPYGYEKSEVGLTVINSKKEKDSSSVIVTPAPKLNKKDHFPYVMGYPDGSFKPEGNITRAEMTAIFSRLLTEKMHVGDNYPLSFSDVARSSWYAEYIGQLTSVGVIAGYPDGTFRPENSVTRAEFATVASRFITSKKSTGGFADILNNHWAKESIENVRAEGWISGYSDGSFKPDQYITRAEVVSIVNKMLDRYADKNYVDSHAMELTNYTDLSKNHWAYYPIMEASNGHDYERLSKNQEVWKTSWKPRKY